MLVVPLNVMIILNAQKYLDKAKFKSNNQSLTINSLDSDRLILIEKNEDPIKCFRLNFFLIFI